MAQITGQILNSQGQPVSPTTVTAKAVVPSGVLTNLNTPSAITATAASDGSLALDLPATIGGTAYELSITQGTLGQPNYWASGVFTVVLYGSEVKRWDTILPTAIPNIRPDLDRSVARVATQITSDPELATQFRSAVGFRFLGNYQANTTYRPGDLVDFQGSTYSPRVILRGIQPPVPPVSNTSWQVVAQQGQPGTGQSGDNSTYNATAWLADTVKPPTKAAVAGMQALNDAQLAQAAKLNVINNWTQPQIFAGTNDQDTVVIPTVSEAPVSPVRFRIPNVLAITQWAAPALNPTFTGTVNVPLAAAGDNTARAASTQWTRQYVDSWAAAERNTGRRDQSIVSHTGVVYPQSQAATDTISPANSGGAASIIVNPGNLVGNVGTSGGVVFRVLAAGVYRVEFNAQMQAVGSATTPVIYWILQYRIQPNTTWLLACQSDNTVLTNLGRFNISASASAILTLTNTTEFQLMMVSRGASAANTTYNGTVIHTVERLRSN